ncbi:MAG: RagB/SusD family nutrient uptake outer membrane protein [Weeksellaceae bacterium]
MKNISYKIIIAIVAFGFFTSCSDDFLEEETYGEVSPDNMNSQENIERAIISAYSVLNGQIDNASNAFNSPASNWTFGDVLSDDAYKGGGGTGDQNQIHQMEIYLTDPTTYDVERKWTALYEGVKRTNLAIRLLQSSDEFNSDLKNTRLGELQFLRGHYYFELKKIYNHIPYIDETAVTPADYNRSNTEFSSEELWSKIESDFINAFNNLPASQEQSGRATKWAAKAYLAKCYIFQQKWQNAYNACNDVIASGNYTLLDDYQAVFLPENDNSSEIIFAVQHSINDGHPNNYNGSIGDRLTAPGGPYPQYGFHRPSQDLVNSFKTDSKGLPTEETTDLTDSDFVDPRLDITVGRPGIPYKDMGILYDASWARDLSTYGPYAPKKRIVSKKSPHYVSTWPYVNSLNYYIIRYAEVLLWKAEAAVELGNFEEARALVNQIRARAKGSEYVKTLDGQSTAAKYNINLYNEPWTNSDMAREAVRKESRLELAMEGKRFFNLVRWGIASETLNQYVQEEKTFRTHLSNAIFIPNKNEYMPIPQKYIDNSADNLIQQNSGY